MLFAAAPAGAAELTPCTAVTPPSGPVVTFDGEASVTPTTAAKRKLKGGGARSILVKPANFDTGRPAYPVGSIGFTDTASQVTLNGGFKLGGRKGKQVQIRDMVLTVKTSGETFVNARFNGSQRRLFNVAGGTVAADSTSGEVTISGGRTKLSAASANAFSKRLGLKKRKRFRAGMSWGQIELFAKRTVTNPGNDDPTGEAPVEPPLKVKPAGATDATGGTINWRVRESFVRYVNSGAGINAYDGATPGPAETVGSAPPLIYTYSFPVRSGWARAAEGDATIYGSGAVGFKYCRNTINFTVAEPEIELDGDANSRLIFRVHGLDGTAFPNSRAVVVKLLPSFGTRTVVGNTVTINDIPGYIPEESTGIFAGFYPPFPGSPDSPDAESARFGSISVSYTTS